MTLTERMSAALQASGCSARGCHVMLTHIQGEDRTTARHGMQPEAETVFAEDAVDETLVQWLRGLHAE